MRLCRSLLVAVLAAHGAAALADGPAATLEARVVGSQAAGMPVRLALTLRNTGTASLLYWVGVGQGRADYPQGHYFKLRMTDSTGKVTEADSWNGQAMGGSGIVAGVRPGKTLVVPVATPPLAAGTWRVLVQRAEAPGTGADERWSWPALSAPELTVTVPQDGKARAKVEAELIAGMRAADLFSSRLAALYGVREPLESILADLSSDDLVVATHAAEALRGVRDWPPSASRRLREALAKHGAAYALDGPGSHGWSDVLAYVLRAAADVHTDELLPLVIGVARRNPRALDAATRALARFPQQAAADELRAMFDGNDPQRRDQAEIGLALRHDPLLLPRLLSKAALPGSHERTYAMLGNYLDDPRVAELLSKAGADESRPDHADAERAHLLLRMWRELP